MKRHYKISIALVFLLVATSVSSLAYKVETNEITMCQIADIIIPDDYSTIQEGIHNANPGQIIFVRSGIYKENIVVQTEDLQIIGENKHTTIIDGASKNIDAIDITADGVKVKGFTISNAFGESWDASGIRIDASDVIVTENIFTSNKLGLCVMAFAYNATITKNSFIDDGLMLGHYQRSEVLNKEDFYHTIQDNTVNSRPLYYVTDQNDYTVPTDAGQVILVNCSKAIVKDLYLSKTDFSVTLAYCDNSTIENLTVVDTDGEVILFSSDYCLIQNNIMINNLHGACLDYYCDYNIMRNNYASENLIGLSTVTQCTNNIFENNTVEKSLLAGIYISTFCETEQYDNVIKNNIVKDNKYGISIALNSNENLVQGNSILGNSIGIWLKESNNNEITNNTLEKNTFQSLFLNCEKNIWNNNYWNRPRTLPKLIFGTRNVGFVPMLWINIDQNPS